MAHRITEEEKEEMRRLREQGLSYDAIARVVGWSRSAITRTCDPKAAASEKAYRARPENMAAHKAYKKVYRQTPERKAKNRAYSKTPGARVRQKAIRQTPRYKAYNKAYQKAYQKEYQKAYRQIPQVRLRNIMRTRLCTALKRGTKSGSAVRDLGCSIQYLIAYLEERFSPGMSWENHAHDGWHIDHILPLSSFDLTDREQFLRACHYTNLQPLWAADNLSKGYKIL